MLRRLRSTATPTSYKSVVRCASEHFARRAGATASREPTCPHKLCLPEWRDSTMKLSFDRTRLITAGTVMLAGAVLIANGTRFSDYTPLAASAGPVTAPNDD